MRVAVAFFVIFGLLCALFGAGIVAIRPTFLGFSRLVPENYRFLVQNALAHKNYDQAEAIVQRRLQKEYYDFEARYLQVEVFRKAGSLDKATSAVADIFVKAQAARGRNVGASGYDEGLTYKLLAECAWESESFVTAGEMFRAAADAGATNCVPDLALPLDAGSQTSPFALGARAYAWLKVGNKPAFQAELGRLALLPESPQAYAVRAMAIVRSDSRTPDFPALLEAAFRKVPDHAALVVLQQLVRDRDADNVLSPHDWQPTASVGLRRLALSQFRLPPGARLSSGTIDMTRNGVASGDFDSGVFRVTNLLLALSGSQALGMWPTLTVLQDGKEIGRAYADSSSPQLYLIPAWPKGAPKSLNLECRFDNDASDPVTSSDRNLRLHFAALY